MTKRRLSTLASLLACCAACSPGALPRGAGDTGASYYFVQAPSSDEGLGQGYGQRLGQGLAQGLGVDLRVVRRLVPASVQLPQEGLTLAARRLHPSGYTELRYTQSLNGLPVVGGDLRVHLDGAGRLRAIHGSAHLPLGALAFSPTITEARALSCAAAEPHLAALTLAPPELMYVVTSGQGRLHLAWAMMAEGAREGLPVRDRAFIDATTCELVDLHPQVHTARSREIRDCNGTQNNNCPVERLEGAAAVGDTDVDTVYEHAGQVHAFYMSNFGRDSYDGLGGTLVNRVHFGNNFANAFWDGQRMTYGDGDGVIFSPLGRDLDIVAHELTHGVTQTEANLVYQNESGALNEAWSDIMAAGLDAWQKNWQVNAQTWTLSESSFTPARAGDALRYLDRPSRANIAGGIPNPEHYDQRYRGTEDNGGVHINSSIANLAFHLMVRGGKHPDPAVSPQVDVQPPLGAERATRIFYLALTKYLTANSNFLAARAATEAAADELYQSRGLRQAVSLGWAAVGVGPVPPPVCQPGDNVCDKDCPTVDADCCVADDGVCVQGCAPIDTDCHCVADGRCSADCKDLAKDPDCPKDCVSNGVCAVDPCPRPDADCVELGAACTTELQCKGRRCVSDLRNASVTEAKVCSKPCTGAAECPAPMECGPEQHCRFPPPAPPRTLGEACDVSAPRCADGLSCLRVVGDQPATCTRTCTTSAECTDGAVCEEGEGGARLCRPAPAQKTLIESSMRGESCSATGQGLTGLWVALAAVAALARRRRCL